MSFAALRRLRFGGAHRDTAARALLAALGLMGLGEQDARGYALRSRCDLVCAGRAPLELVRPDGVTQIQSLSAGVPILIRGNIGPRKSVVFWRWSRPVPPK